MKAAVLIATGKDEDLERILEIKEVPTPSPSDDEIQINIKYSSLNHRDLWIARGMYSKIKLPAILGSDGAGTISGFGKNVSGFNIGDEVIINPGFNWGEKEDFQSKEFRILGMPDNGTLSEYITVDKSYVYKKPLHLDLSQAAALPLAGVTAYRALFKKAKLKSNDNVLITGTGGGVASLALQLAIKVTPNVFVTSSDDEKILRAVTFGAKAGANYNNNDWADKLNEITNKKIDIVIDSAGGKTFSKLIELCSYGGTIVSYGATNGIAENADLYKTYWKQLKILGTVMGSQKDFSDMMDFISVQKINPIIDSIYSIDKISDAFRKMEVSGQFGKIIIEI